jgi:hypothetical protein
MPEEPEEWYRPGKSIQEFHDSDCFAAFLIGARGAGKTTSVAVDAIGHAFHNAGARVVGLRKSEKSQGDTTIHTFNTVFASMGQLYQETPDGTGLFASWNDGKVIRVPSRMSIEKFNNFKALRTRKKGEIVAWLDTEGKRLCSWMEFRGLPHSAISENKLRGLECSYMILIEADLLEKQDFALAVPVVGRWKGSDPSVCDERGFIADKRLIIDSNPPSPSHWIAEYEKEWKTGDPDKANWHFWHIPTAENSHNLPDGYVETLIATYKSNPALLAKYVYGDYADAYDGNPVLWKFDASGHVYQDLPFPEGAYLVRGWDFGTNNAVVWSAYWEQDGTEYWWDLHERHLEGSDTEMQAREALRITEEEFPFWNNRHVCSGIMDFCDPAGNNSNFGMSDKRMRSSVAILKTYGIHPGYSRMGFQQSVAVNNRLLEVKDKKGEFVYRMDKEGCPMLYRASLGAWRYPSIGEPGYGQDYPLKGALCGNVDHVADAARYAKQNCLKLIRAQVEKALGKVGPLDGSRNRNPNPNKRR